MAFHFIDHKDWGMCTEDPGRSWLLEKKSTGIWWVSRGEMIIGMSLFVDSRRLLLCWCGIQVYLLTIFLRRTDNKRSIVVLWRSNDRSNFAAELCFGRALERLIHPPVVKRHSGLLCESAVLVCKKLHKLGAGDPTIAVNIAFSHCADQSKHAHNKQR